MATEWWQPGISQLSQNETLSTQTLHVQITAMAMINDHESVNEMLSM